MLPHTSPRSIVQRPRRLRTTAGLRRMVRETVLAAENLIYPLFVAHGSDVRRPIPSMPGVFHLSTDTLVAECEAAFGEGVPAVLLFGIPEAKDAVGSEAYADDGIVQQAVRALKRHLPDLLVVTDVCLCEYTDHGHCGIIRDRRVINDETLGLLARTAVSHAAAGADIVAPSDMMDARIGAIRQALDEAGFAETVSLMSYAAKYASAFYGPFREAAGSAPAFGDRRSYQMDPANRREALREVRLDIAEGADIVMVKPALAYLDIVRDVREMTELPVAAYNVSGEYAMIKAAAANGWLEERRTVLEMLLSMRRAGADLILTYHARDAARWLSENDGP
ncbi:MAG: porphobilinogen synthase [Capsulimonadales bacterium]|nr:porphobilinogen synthase [Capsulimonadales bacterium]